jgi:hypothetical protein
MPVYVRWDDDTKQVLHYTIEGDWTAQDFVAAVRQGIAMQKSVDYMVDVISNFTNSNNIPLAWSQVNGVLKGAPKWGVNAIVTNGMLLTNMVQVGSRLYPKVYGSFVVVRTLDEARKLCAESRMQRHT